jgi:aminomethyltransferase
MADKQTPLAARNAQLGAKTMPFAGWQMPLHYGSVLSEHKSVRTDTGLFDVSHMCLFRFDDKEFAQTILATDLASLQNGQARYSLILNENGGVLEDCILYNIGGAIWVCSNAANHQTVSTWFAKNQQKAAAKSCLFKDLSEKYAILALQGPNVGKVLTNAFPKEVASKLLSLEFMHVATSEVGGFVARSGYTGELGFEFFAPAENAEALFQSLLEAGAKPAGLGCRDTLRLESCFHLHGSDMDSSKNPFEVGLGWSIPKSTELSFVGADALRALDPVQKKCRLIAFELEQKGIPRAGMNIYSDATSKESIGQITSGGFLPTLGLGGGLAFLNSSGSVKVGEQFLIDIRGKRVSARRRKLPLYKSRAKDILEAP